MFYFALEQGLKKCGGHISEVSKWRGLFMCGTKPAGQERPYCPYSLFCFTRIL